MSKLNLLGWILERFRGKRTGASPTFRPRLDALEPRDAPSSLAPVEARQAGPAVVYAEPVALREAAAPARAVLATRAFDDRLFGDEGVPALRGGKELDLFAGNVLRSADPAGEAAFVSGKDDGLALAQEAPACDAVFGADAA